MINFLMSMLKIPIRLVGHYFREFVDTAGQSLIKLSISSFSSYVGLTTYIEAHRGLTFRNSK